MIEKNLKISVCVTTYNQEQYIGECLESIVTQKCNFDFEVIVGEDCSTDNTRAIVQEYADQYPDIVKPIFHEKNIGGEKNYLIVHNKALGDYICTVDGDDYALPGKLQAQADFLDTHNDCNIVWHRSKILSNETLYEDTVVYNKLPKDGFTRADLIMGIGTGQHMSKMYRNLKKIMELPPFTVLDLYLHIEHLQDAKAYYVNDNFYGVYREGVGISSQGDTISILQSKTLVYLANKYPLLKEFANTRILMQFLVALKHKRYKVSKLFFLAWIKTFHIKSFFYTFRNIKKDSLYFVSRSKKKI